MNLSEIRTRLSDVYGDSATAQTAFLNRVINDAYHKLCSLNDWWWLETYSVLTFNAPVGTGLPYDCVQGTATITPSTATAAVGTAYKYGWAYTGEHVYRILNVNGASPYTITLDSNFLETSSAYSMALWNDFATLPSAFDHAVALSPRMEDKMKPLAQVPYEEIERYGPDMSPYYSDIAQVFSVFRETVIDDDFRIRIFPPPDTEVEYILRYIQTPPDLSNDADVPLVPTKHQSCLIDLARLELMKVTGAEANEVSYWEGESQKGVAKMIQDQFTKGKIKHQFGRYTYTSRVELPFKLTNYTEGVDAS